MHLHMLASTKLFSALLSCSKKRGVVDGYETDIADWRIGNFLSRSTLTSTSGQNGKVAYLRFFDTQVIQCDRSRFGATMGDLCWRKRTFWGSNISGSLVQESFPNCQRPSVKPT